MKNRDYLDISLSPEERAKDLLSQMSVSEKIAQVNCLFAQPGQEEQMKREIQDGIGQVSLLEMRCVESLDQAAMWQRKMQQLIVESNPHRIPAIFHMEGLCGAYVRGAVSFPTGIARGSSFDPELEKKVAETVSRQERSVGVGHIFAPVLDVARDPRMGRQGESYGEDPSLVAAMGSAFVSGIQSGETDGRRSEAVAKHFLGFHHSLGGIHGADTQIPGRLLRETYGKPFQAAIKEAHLRGVMPCYCTMDGSATSASKKLLTGLLREEMGFDGVVVSDYCAVGNVFNEQHQYESLAEAGLKCMEAGLDMELPSMEGFGPELREWFEAGKADMKVLDQAVYRVLCAKFRMGLFEHPYALSDKTLQQEFFNERDREITLQSAREAMVLLKNDGTLPISGAVKKIAVIGCHAANARFFFGGYTNLSMVEAILSAEGSMAGVATENSAVDVENGIQPGSYRCVPGTQIQSDETKQFDEILTKLHPGCKSLLEELQDRFQDAEVQTSSTFLHR